MSALSEGTDRLSTDMKINEDIQRDEVVMLGHTLAKHNKNFNISFIEGPSYLSYYERGDGLFF